MELLKRFRLLVIKLIGVKGLVFIIATVLLFMGKIGALIWFFSAIGLISFRALEKILIGKYGGKK